MARIAASRTLSGVSKSGSPAASEITSRPSRFMSAALREIATVADGAMRKTASDKKAMESSGLSRRRLRRWASGTQESALDSEARRLDQLHAADAPARFFLADFVDGLVERLVRAGEGHPLQ